MKSKRLAIIGECMIELSGQPFTLMKQNYGGDSMNTAIYIKILTDTDIDVHYISSMGTDSLSKAVIEKWQQQQINTDFVLLNPDKHAGLYMIQNNTQGERYFQYWRNDSAARYLLQQPGFAEIIKQLADFDAIYLSGISLAILPEHDCQILLAHLQQLKQQGVKIIYDSNYRPKLWSSTKFCQAINNQAYRLADLALVTFDDEAQLWQDPHIEDCRQRLHHRGVKALVIKDGANGCQYSELAIDGTINTLHYPTTLIEKVVDTTAAGDSFNAGFLSQWLIHGDIAQSACVGNRLAAQVIQQQGAIVDIDKTTITAVLKQQTTTNNQQLSVSAHDPKHIK